MPDVSEEVLRKEIEKILKSADLSKVSSKKVIQQLEETFNTELKDRKAVGKLVMDCLNAMEDDDDEDAEDDDDDEEEKPKSKNSKKDDDDDDDDDDDEEEEEPKKPPKRSAASSKRSKKARKASSEESEEADDSYDSEYEEKKAKRKKAAPKGKKGGAKGGARGKGGGYTRAYKLSPALADLMGADEMPRHEVVKRMWAIIKEKQLHDPNNRQFAICDDPLYKVIGTKRFRIFGMMKYLKSHFLDE